MKYLLQFFLIAFVGITLQAQPGLKWPEGTVGKDFNVKDAKGKRQGLWVRTWANKPQVLYYKGQFKDDVPVGLWEWYYESGELMTLMTHVKGDQITDNVFFYPNGTSKMSEGRFEVKVIDGKKKRCKEGGWRFFNEAGTLKAEELYRDSLLSGPCTYYYDDGQLLKTLTYDRGLREGAFVEYHPNGKKAKEGTFLRDDFEGGYIAFHENGKVHIEGAYVKGLKNGVWTYYEPSGAIQMRVKYEMNREVKRQYMEGSPTDYYESGIPKSQYTWEDGKKNGPFTEWYDKGKFEQVPTDKEDQAMGITFREKLTGQQICREGDFVNDLLEGEVKVYTEDGKLDRIEVYSDGKIISTKKSK